MNFNRDTPENKKIILIDKCGFNLTPGASDQDLEVIGSSLPIPTVRGRKLDFIAAANTRKFRILNA